MGKTTLTKIMDDPLSSRNFPLYFQGSVGAFSGYLAANHLNLSRAEKIAAAAVTAIGSISLAAGATEKQKNIVAISTSLALTFKALPYISETKPAKDNPILATTLIGLGSFGLAKFLLKSPQKEEVITYKSLSGKLIREA